MKNLILGVLLALFGLVAAEAQQVNNPTTVTGISPIVVSGIQVGIQAPDRTVTTSTGVTIQSTDFGGQVNVNNASAQNVTTPTSMSAGQTFTVVNQGAGVLTIVNGGVATNGLSFTTINQYGFITCTANSGGSADCAGVQGGSSSGFPITIGGQSISGGGSTTNQGNGGKIQLSTGTTTTNDCAKFDANGNTVDAGGTCTTGGGGTNAHLAAQVISPDPTGTTSTSPAVMMGMGSTCHITPTNSGAITLLITGVVTNSNTAGGAQIGLYYGTGTAPSNAAALTGTKLGNITGVGQANNTYYPFALTAVVTGQATGTSLWFDDSLNAVSSGTASILAVTCSASES